jgi:M6 family metalloprotease-like protein
MKARFSRMIVIMATLALSIIGACQPAMEQSPEMIAEVATPIQEVTPPTDVRLGIHTSEAVGERKYMVILADFPDVERRYSVGEITNRLLNLLSDYLYSASYQKLTFKGEVAGPYLLPNSVEDYRISPANLHVDREKVLLLVNDAIRAADADIEYSLDLDVIIALGATNKEYGMVGYSAVPGMLDFTTTTGITAPSGETIGNVTVFCENAHMGTYVHDTLHQIGGVVNGRRMTPCLYDHYLQEKYADTTEVGRFAVNMGFWDPLSSHVPYDRALPPAGLSSWTKLRLGWIDPSQIALVYPGETATIRLDPLVSRDASTLVIRIPVGPNNYYLIENRQPVGPDVNLPSSGVLVSYADDSVLECRHGNAPVKLVDANPDTPYLNGAAFDIGGRDTFVDPGNNLAFILQRKDGLSYDIRVTTSDQVDKPVP